MMKNRCYILISLFALIWANVDSIPALAQTNSAQTTQVPSSEKSQETDQKNRSQANVEVMFVLDTTGSMSGLIEAAKQKIWSIANQIATGTPTPNVRMGLIAYRDKGDEYVTQTYPLTDDLDAIFAALMKFRADGGGDHPENVNLALYEAVHKINWSPDPKTFRTIFLVGDAPPHTDYQDVAAYTKTCEHAVKKDLIINTIRCGGDPQTEQFWQDIAHRTSGSFITIAQDGGVIAMSTPYDKDLASLDTKLTESRVAYGKKERKAEMEASKLKATEGASRARSYAPEAAAERASYMAKTRESSTATGMDLLDDLNKDAVKLNSLKEDELPEEMKNMDEKSRNEYLERKKQERASLEKEISELSKKRDEFLSLKRKEMGTKDSFDEGVLTMLREQAAKKGIRY